MTGATCGTRHYRYTESLCTEPAGHYVRERDPHAAPLIIDGRERGGLAWDEPEPPVTNRHTVNTITSNALDQLYADLDQARQHASAIAAQRDRLRQRMNTLADRWDHALAPDKPYARTLREEISCAPFDPEGAMTVQEYTERGRRLWAFRCWGTDTCDGWLGLEHPTQTSALAERERHGAEAHIETGPRDTGCQRARAERAEAAIARVCAIPRLPHSSQQTGELGRAYTRGWESVINALDTALDQPTSAPAATEAAETQEQR